MAHDIWRSLTVKDLIPALDPDDPSSMLSQAKDSIDSSFDEFDSKVTALNDFTNSINELRNAAYSAKNSVNSVIDSIGETGIYATIYKDIVGRNEYESAFVSSLNDEDAPEITESTYVGAVHMVVTGASTEEVENKLGELEDIMKGLL